MKPLKGRPSINSGDLDLERVTNATWRAILIANEPPFIFRHGGLLARIENTDDGFPILQTITQDHLRHILARIADWYRKKEGKRRPALPPKHVVQDMLVRSDPPLPPLTKIVATPVFARDGTLQILRGYHASSRTYYAPPSGLTIPAVAVRPKMGDLDRARGLILDDLLGDFPFVGDAERAHAVAFLLLPFVRELIDGSTPLHLIEKPSPGTGASLLADVLTFPSSLRPISTLTEGRDEDEWRKRITAKLLNGPSTVLIDNLRRRLESSAVSAVITAPIWEDRLLGHSKMIRVPVRCAWLATGNNPALSPEIIRRTVRIRLDAKTERPWLRNGFRHPDLHGWMNNNRGELVWAALTIIQAWLAARRPEGTSTFGMFERWSHIMDGILAVAGILGFLDNLDEFYEASDSDAEVWGIFVNSWWDYYGVQEVGVSDLYALVVGSNGNPTIDLDLGNGPVHSRKIRLGKMLVANRDRLFGGRRIIQTGTRQRAQLWRLVQRSP